MPPIHLLIGTFKALGSILLKSKRKSSLRAHSAHWSTRWKPLSLRRQKPKGLGGFVPDEKEWWYAHLQDRELRWEKEPRAQEGGWGRWERDNRRRWRVWKQTQKLKLINTPKPISLEKEILEVGLFLTPPPLAGGWLEGVFLKQLLTSSEQLSLKSTGC